MEDQELDNIEDFDGYDNYYNTISVRPVLGGWTVAYSDRNPNYVIRGVSETYDSKRHVQAFQRTRIFTDATKLVEWLQTRIQKETK